MYADPQQKAQFLWLAECNQLPITVQLTCGGVYGNDPSHANCIGRWYGSVGVKKFDKAWESIICSFFINNYSECWLVWFFDVGIDLPSYSSRWLR